VTLHPVVVVSILDHHIRRSEGYRVIGTLLGSNTDGNIEIRDCFPVPHSEGAEVGVDMDFHHNMLDLHHRISPKDSIVGWYSTGSELSENSVILHDFYGKKLTHSPIHLLVDTNLTNFTLSVKAYTATTVVLNEKQLGAQFLPIHCDILSLDSEKIGVDALIQSKTHNELSLFSDLDGLEISVKKLQQMLDTLTDYVNKVVEGKIEGDTNVGLFIAGIIQSLPKLDQAQLEKMFNNSTQDLLLVIYLANLTRTQLHLAEKLQKV